MPVEKKSQAFRVGTRGKGEKRGFRGLMPERKVPQHTAEKREETQAV